MSSSGSLTSGVSGRYATALFELARDANQLDTVEADMVALKEALGDSADLSALISSPIYTRDQQKAGITAVADKMGLSSLVKNTLGLMAEKRRLFALASTAEGILGLIADHRGEVTAEVTAAKPLSDAQRDQLAETLRQAAGKEVKINTTVDESLIGGLVVRLGSRMVDTSIRAKLDALRTSMKEVG